MKRLLVVMAAAVVALALACPALAASLGISPSRVELEVPGDGSATADFQVHYFSGDVKVSLVEIPLRVEPDVLHVDALDNPVDIQLTIFGDESLGSQVYKGFIKFTGMSGEMIAIAVQVRAMVTNIVAGQPLPPIVPPPVIPPTVTLEKTESSPAITSPEPTSPPSGSALNLQSKIDGLSLNLVIIIAGGLVFMGLVILAVSLAVRRRGR